MWRVSKHIRCGLKRSITPTEEGNIDLIWQRSPFARCLSVVILSLHPLLVPGVYPNPWLIQLRGVSLYFCPYSVLVYTFIFILDWQNGGHFNSISSLLTSHVGQSYTDPVLGASCSFLHRISELSCLEGETVRQEKLKRTRMSRKASSSWRSLLPQSKWSRGETDFESMTRTGEGHQTLRATCLFKWLLFSALLSSLVLIFCLTWLVVLLCH